MLQNEMVRKVKVFCTKTGFTTSGIRLSGRPRNSHCRLLLVVFARLCPHAGFVCSRVRRLLRRPRVQTTWPVATLDSAGLTSDTLCPVVKRLPVWKEANVHAMLFARHGKLVFSTTSPSRKSILDV